MKSLQGSLGVNRVVIRRVPDITLAGIPETSEDIENP
jgi:hypothetical protein